MEENENRTNPAEEAENETEAIRALRDAYEERLRQKENEISAMKKAHADQIREILKGGKSAGDSAETPEEDPIEKAARVIAEKYKIRRL